MDSQPAWMRTRSAPMLMLMVLAGRYSFFNPALRTTAAHLTTSAFTIAPKASDEALSCGSAPLVRSCCRVGAYWTVAVVAANTFFKTSDGVPAGANRPNHCNAW
jgi:hypothetical protein